MRNGLQQDLYNPHLWPDFEFLNVRCKNNSRNIVICKKVLNYAIAHKWTRAASFQSKAHLDKNHPNLECFFLYEHYLHIIIP